MTTPDTGELGAVPQFVRYAIKRRQPVLHEVVGIALAEEAGGGTEAARAVIAPCDAAAPAERILHFDG